MKKTIGIIIVVTLVGLLMLSGCSNSDRKGDEVDLIETEKDTIGSNSDSTESDKNFIDLEVELADYGLKIPKELNKYIESSKVVAYSVEPNSIFFEYLTQAGDDFFKENSESNNVPELTNEQIENYYVQLMIFIRTEEGNDTDRYDSVKAFFENSRELATKEGFDYTLYYNDVFDKAILTNEEQLELQDIIEQMEYIEGDVITLYEELVGDGDLVFETQTLQGEEVTSAIFAEYDLTMVNIWATWCRPCVSELPELGELYHELPEGVNLIGIATDGESDGDVAIEMLDEYGCDYMNILLDRNLQTYMNSNVKAIPTTIFVDSNGNIVGDPMVGVPLNPKEDYLAKINELLGN